MTELPSLFAKLAGIKKQLDTLLAKKWISYSTVEVLELFERHIAVREKLKVLLPDLYGDLGLRELPPIKGPPEFSESRIEQKYVEQLRNDVDYLLEVRSSSRPGDTSEDVAKPKRVFISHGRSPEWREVQAHIEKDLDTPTLELAQEPNRGRTLLQKLSEEASRCSFAVIVMTGDDVTDFGAPRARENVIHEIGYFQGKYGLDRICLLYEEGTNVPTNIQGLVYVPFPKGLVKAAFGELHRELKAAYP